jgi:DNA-binding transcriptional regulator YiaG
MSRAKVFDLDRDMSPAEFTGCMQRLGLMQIDAAAFLGVTTRSIRRYARGQAAIPVPTVLLLRLLMRHNYFVQV